MNIIEETGFPIPPAKGFKTQLLKQSLMNLPPYGVGETKSFLCQGLKRAQISQVVTRYAQESGKKFVTKEMPDGIRIWRTDSPNKQTKEDTNG